MLRPSFARLLRTLASLSPKKEEPVPLGRWNVKYDEETIAKTVQWSNEDNCGVCSQEFKYVEQTSDNLTSRQQNDITNIPKNNSTSLPISQTKITIDNCCGNGCPNCPVYIEFFCSNRIH